MDNEDKLYCEKCKKETEFLYSKTKYNGNIDVRDLCIKCYEEIHEESFNG